MKKHLLSLALVVAGTMAAHAQNGRLGFKAGVSLASFVGDDVTSSSSGKFGFHGGLVASLGITDRLSVQPELLYSMKGTKDSGSNNNGSITGYQTLHYVDVPVLLKLRFNQLFLEAGPQAGVLAGATATVEGNGASQSIGNKSSFNDVDFGYALGLGFQAESGLMLGFRYNGAFTNVPKEVTIRGQSIQPKARNSAFQLYVGYLLHSK